MGSGGKISCFLLLDVLSLDMRKGGVLKVPVIWLRVCNMADRQLKILE